MYPPDFPGITQWIANNGILLFEGIGGLIIVYYAVFALIRLIRTHNIEEARLTVAEGALMGLSFKLAASLLKTLVLLSWDQILIFAAIFAIRTVLKMVFTWEQRRIQGNQAL